MEVYDGHKVTKNEFALKIATTMKDLSSSHVFFIIQMAFGEMERDSAADILNSIINKKKI